MNKITTGFNILATILIIILYGFQILFEGAPQTKSLFNILLDKNPLIGLFLAVFALLITVSLSMYVVKELWNRLIVNIFQLKEINYCEAYAIILVLVFLSK